MTKYLVFRKAKQAASTASGGPQGWVEFARVDAQSADAAIRDLVAKNADEREAEYAAVPARSWKPRQVTVERTPRVKLS